MKYRAKRYEFRTCIEELKENGDWTILHSFQNREQKCRELIWRMSRKQADALELAKLQ